MELIFQLTPVVTNFVNDVAGLWQFEGGQVAQGGSQVGNYACVRRVVYKGSDQDDQDSAMVTTTIFFLGNLPPENITLQGVHRFAGGWDLGSVSAASYSYQPHVGHQYNRDGSTNVVTIF